MKNPYRKTFYACYTGYIVQGIVNNLTPLLFVTFISSGWVSLRTVTLLTTFNFLTQLTVDLLSVRFVDKIGYRTSMVLAHILAALGLVSLAVLPFILPSPFAGLLISVFIYAVGSGLIEVLVSPIVEACPSDNKAASMSILHSFYCWGVVFVISLTTLYLSIFGRDSWRSLCFIWALVPFFNAFAFAKVPIKRLTEVGEGMSVRELFGSKMFWIFAILMIAAGACELGMSQWASTFAEEGLGVSKAVGDLAGPCLFAILMGTARALYGKFGEKINLRIFIMCSGGLCLLSYILASASGNPVISLLGCGLCGFSVGIMWPGVFSLASASTPRGGTALFALLALAGDLGCTGGPTLVGFVSSGAGDNLRAGLGLATVFPIMMIIGLAFLGAEDKKSAK